MEPLRALRRTIERALLLLFTTGLGACHTDVLPPVPQAPLSACLSFLVTEDGIVQNRYDRDVQKAVRIALETAMVGAGFNVLDNPGLPHDLTVRVVTLPGSRVETDAKVRVTLSLEHEGKAIDQINADAPAESRDYAGVLADQLIDALFRSGPLAGYTRDLRKADAKKHLAASALRQAMASGSAVPVCAQAPAPPPSSSVSSPPPPPTAPPAPPPAAGEPMIATPQPDAYAFIVGVEDYRTAPAARGARADAERFAAWVRRSLGVPEPHIKVVLNDKADRLAFDLTVEWMKLNVGKEGRIYFYFSGRGSYRRASYLLPYDADPKAADKTGVSLSSFLQDLAKTQAREILAFVDTSYAGSGDRSFLPADAPVPRSIGDIDLGPRVGLVSAVTGAETASVGPTGGGLFTRFLLEALGNGKGDIDGDGQVTLQEIVSWAGPRVSREARKAGHTQTPSVVVGPAVGSPAGVVVAAGLPTQ
ncbi:MAG: caspase family protein [Byssovorax sp.]